MLVFSLVAHEYAHAVVAYRQGDDTAYMLGRITLNPLPHIDPWMSILMPGLMWVLSNGAFVFGGAKPVPVNPRKYRRFVRGDVLVSSAGVITNLGLSVLFALLFVGVGLLARLAPGLAGPLDSAQRMMMWGIWLNLLLCFFNLIPVPPLDGSHLFYHLLPPSWGARYRALQNFGLLPLLALMFLFRPLFALLLSPAFFAFHLLQRLVLPYALGDGWRILG